MIAGEQGRLLFPAAAAFATILVIGWIGWLPRRLQEWAALAVGAGMLALGIWQYQTVQTTYATPPALAAPVTPSRMVDATFSGGMQLVGFDLPEGAATDFSKPLPLTLYFQAVAPVPEDYTLFIHLVDGENRMLYQYDGIPYQGRHPPRQWRAGEIFADHYEILPKPETATALAGQITNTLASLTLGFYPVLRPQERLPVLDANGQPVGDRVLLAKIRILPEESLPSPGRADKRQGKGKPVRRGRGGRMGSCLQDVTVAQARQRRPQRAAAAVEREQNGQRDYTVFVQALDAAGHLLAQVDQQPQQGRAPTSTWLAGEEIVDTLTFSQPLDGWRQVIVGLYDETGQRLPLAGPAGGDHVVILQNPS